MKLLIALAIPFACFSQELELLHVKGNVHLIASPAGNVAVHVGRDPGHDGVLLVNTGPADQLKAMEAKLRMLTREPVRFILQTSADPNSMGATVPMVAATDANLGGNLRPNDQASIAVYATDNVLTRLSAEGSGIPSSGWPTLTFDGLKTFDFNGEAIQLFAEPAAHSDGDAVIFFRGSNVVATGSIFRTTGYPVVDVARGGSIGGLLRALNHILDLTVPRQMQEGGTMVIPGEGRICDEADVAEVRDMMTILRDRVAALKSKGQPLSEVQAARVTRDYDKRWSTPAWTGEMLVEAIYKTLDARDAKEVKR